MKFKTFIFFTIFVLFSNIAIAKSKEEFTNVFSFGDSFSYGGTWAEFITTRYGFNYVSGKTGFAIGGGKTSDLPNMLATYNANVNGYDSNALYMIFMGPSDSAHSFNHQTFGGVYAPDQDFLNALNLFFPNNLNAGYRDIINLINSRVTTIQQIFPLTIIDVNSRATLLGNFVHQISNSGANYIVVLNMFNDSLRQHFYQSSYYIHGIWSDLYNRAIYNKIEQLAPKANVIYVDTNRFISEVTNNPSAYFSASDISSSLYNQGFFDYTAHPTSSAQKLLTQYISSIIESPTRVAIVREIPFTNGERLFKDLRNQAKNLAHKQMEKRLSIDVITDYSNSSTGSFTKKRLGFQNSGAASGEVVLNFQAKDNLTLGLLVFANNTKMDFVKGYGKANIIEYGIFGQSIYYFSEPYFIYSAIGVGDIKYVIDRRIPLGVGANFEKGKSSGKHYMGILGTGYRFSLKENISLTPYVSINYQTISIKPYVEKSSIRSTTMSFNIPNRESIASEIGVTLSNDFNVKDEIKLKPSLTISYSYDFKDPMKKQIRGKVSDMPREFLVPAYKLSESRLLFEGAVDGTITNTLFLRLSASVRPLNKVKQWSLGLALRKQF